MFCHLCMYMYTHAELGRDMNWNWVYKSLMTKFLAIKHGIRRYFKLFQKRKALGTFIDQCCWRSHLLQVFKLVRYHQCLTLRGRLEIILSITGDRACEQCLKLRSDIGHFPRICSTCPSKSRCVPPKCPRKNISMVCVHYETRKSSRCVFVAWA